jgi:glutaredoxin 3
MIRRLFFFTYIFLFLICIFVMMVHTTDRYAIPRLSYAGEMYTWVDEKGEIHYSDTQPDHLSLKNKKALIIPIDNNRGDDNRAVEKTFKGPLNDKRDMTRTASSKNVTIYTLDTCPYCHQAKEFLSQQGIDYQEIDVGRDRDGAYEMMAISGQKGVPVIVIDGDVIVGFDREILEEKLR